jgi:hypothetical protein
VQLSAKEYELLVALAEDPERVFKKEELLRDVWGFRSLSIPPSLSAWARLTSFPHYSPFLVDLRGSFGLRVEVLGPGGV